MLGGAVEYADKLLGAPFTVTGEVLHGDERGRTLGFPTANLVPRDGYVLPGHGVYACRARTADGGPVAVRPTPSRASDVRDRAWRAFSSKPSLVDFDL